MGGVAKLANSFIATLMTPFERSLLKSENHRKSIHEVMAAERVPEALIKREEEEVECESHGKMGQKTIQLKYLLFSIQKTTKSLKIG